MSQHYRLGDWIFDPDIGTLSRDSDLIRLENRASRLLDLLCRRQGELVTHTEIIETVWDGRSVSPNSIAVVIGNIRKALGDSAKAPHYIETVPKRGYLLLIPADASHINPGDVTDYKSTSTGKKRKRLTSLTIGLALISIILFAAFRIERDNPSAQTPLPIAVLPLTNATGDAAYAPLIAAYTDLILNDLVRADSVAVVDVSNSNFQVKSQIILWNDQPSISIILTDEDEAVLWSGMAPGPQSKLVGQVQVQLRDLIRVIEERETLF